MFSRPDLAPLCWFILLRGHKQGAPKPTCLAPLGRRDGIRKHGQGPSMGMGRSWVGALRAMGLHPLPEAPQSLGFGAGDRQHGPMCVAYQPSRTQLPVLAISKRTLILHWDVFSTSQPLQLLSTPHLASPRRRRAPGSTAASLGTRRSLERGCRATNSMTWLQQQHAVSQRPPHFKKRQVQAEKLPSACSSVQTWTAKT